MLLRKLLRLALVKKPDELAAKAQMLGASKTVHACVVMYNSHEYGDVRNAAHLLGVRPPM